MGADARSTAGDAGPSFRPATLQDVDAIAALIAESARALGRADYTPAQIEAALQGAWGVDTQIIEDGSYFVAEHDGVAVICGGWSRFATPFGGDAFAGREPRRLDPRTEAARIRAFFVRPSWARRGLASALLRRCERRARAAGFRACELTATRPGQRFYARHGYIAEPARRYPLPGGVEIEFVPMRRELA